jgi:rhodanese-related sulfurtransferase
MSDMLEYDPAYWMDQQIRFQHMANKSGTDLINEAKTRIPEVGVAEATAAPNVVWLDVREPNEWNLGRIPGAKFIPRGQLETNVEKQIPRDANVVIYCASGNRSALAADTMRIMGYDHVSSLRGGFRAWVDAGGEVEG